jgi:hypothetical protein
MIVPSDWREFSQADRLTEKYEVPFLSAIFRATVNISICL